MQESTGTEAIQKQIDAIRQRLTNVEAIEKHLSGEFSTKPFENLNTNIFFTNLIRYLSKKEPEKDALIFPAFLENYVKIDQLVPLLLQFYDNPGQKQLPTYLLDFAKNNNSFCTYFAAVGFPNIYQQFVSQRYCNSASNLIDELIEKADSTALQFVQSLLVSFIVRYIPFIDEFRKFISSALYKPTPSINTEAFQLIFSFLTSSHLTTINKFVIKFGKESFCPELATELLTMIDSKEDILAYQKARDYYFKEYEALKNALIDAIKFSIDNLSDASSYECPDIENDLLYLQPHKVYFTFADLLVLDQINMNEKKQSFLFKIKHTSKQYPLYNIVQTSFRIESQDHLPSYDVLPAKLSPNQEIHKSEFYDLLEQAKMQGIDPVTLFQKSPFSTIYLELYLLELQKKENIMKRIQTQLHSMYYLKKISEVVIDEMQREAFFKYSKMIHTKYPKLQSDKLSERFYQDFFKADFPILIINKFNKNEKEAQTILNTYHDIINDKASNVAANPTHLKSEMESQYQTIASKLNSKEKFEFNADTHNGITKPYLTQIAQNILLLSTTLSLTKDEVQTRNTETRQLQSRPLLSNYQILITMFNELNFKFNYQTTETKSLFKSTTEYIIPNEDIVNTVFLFHQLATHIQKDIHIIDSKLARTLIFTKEIGQNLNFDFLKLIAQRISDKFRKENNGEKTYFIDRKLVNSIDLFLDQYFPEKKH